MQSELTEFNQQDHPETAESNSNNHQEQIPIPLDTETLRNKHLEQFLAVVDTEEIQEFICKHSDETNILKLIQVATTNNDLAGDIKEITQHRTSDPDIARTAADNIEETIGCRPFNITITDEDEDYIDPLISLDVDDKWSLTENPTINAEIINEVTKTFAETESGQYRLYEKWSEIFGQETIKSFKKNRDPDALGFAIPEHVPGTGDINTRTPVTEISYIGPSTAADIHPNGELMSLQDFSSLTSKQQTLIDPPFDIDNLGKNGLKALASTVDITSTNTTAIVALLFDFTSRKHRKDKLLWTNDELAVGLLKDPYMEHVDVLEPVCDTKPYPTDDNNEDTTHTTAITENFQTIYSEQYWELIKTVASETSDDIYIGDDLIATVELPDGNWFSIAPRIEG